MSEKRTTPNFEPALKTIAMPKDTNPNGDIFGGWLLSQMDLAGAVVVKEECDGAVVTVAVDAMTFHEPVFIGDQVSCYVKIIKVGRTSVTVHIETWARRKKDRTDILVTEGHFTYVAIDSDRRPRPIYQD
ncbi:MAG: acyl-CoA thioesterase [Rickettsiales bacterium]|nr:acyl-CoA thioesterase [Rickettsiales bacterium]|tara:strand:+ start:494 stop:883 length:390 start_codon:yes stop_codon:yes gene_type:complete